MSKQDNLKDFLTDIADAVREKKGTTEPINAQNLSEEIRGIESGGISTAEWNDVNFYDYEGTILYSYSWDEFVAKNEMPPLPTHREKEGLVCKEWNYTLEEVLEQGGRCDVGAIYTTFDGYSHLHVLAHNTNTRIVLTFSEYNTVDWGDGIVDSVKGEASHTYSEAGAYDIVIKGSGQILMQTTICDRIHICHPHTLQAGRVKTNSVSIDERVTSLKIDQAFGLEHLTLNRNIKNFGAYQVYSIHRFKSISLTNDTTLYTIGSNTSSPIHIPSKAELRMAGTQYLDNISLSVKNPYYEKVNGCIIDLGKKEVIFMESGATIPDGVLSIAKQIPYANFSKIIMPDSVNSVAPSCFHDIIYGFMLVSKNLMYIPTKAFMYATGDVLFINHESVPVMENSDAFIGITNKKIVVPDALYDEWIVATNWSAYAPNIVKASEFVEPTTE